MINLKSIKQSFVHQLTTSECTFYSKLQFSRCNFELANFHERLFEAFGIIQPSSILNSVAKRKAEFLAGRLVAQNALQSLASFPETFYSTPVQIGKYREPIFTDGFIGSITHTNKTAVALVGNNADYAGIGIDRENWLSCEVAEEIASQILFYQTEKTKDFSELNFQQFLTLLYSAKESFFKAAFQQVGDYFDFDAVALTDIDQKNKQFELKVMQDLSPSLRTGVNVTGFFVTDLDGVETFIAIK